MLNSVFARAGQLDFIPRSLQRSTTMSDNLFLMTWIGLIVAFWVGLYYFDKWRKSRGGVVGSGKSLFLDLCRVHGLSRQERSLLLKAAKLHQPLEPAVIFVDPQILARCTTAPPPDNEGYASLSAKLFEV
jgi:hypothetical protein